MAAYIARRKPAHLVMKVAFGVLLYTQLSLNLALDEVV